ncbi:MAG: bifunctional 2-polyprenyl-6-hydroxyphenol methylase/3-demethylubiquinol 3-O-methyltransferase UbiG [Candidatus Accumulibacter sp.]|jgi:2-polyprenyl-6-hydroxyphenyl methylase/3-demethylubiquinone-9 3-methyltransferase|nr:bifunctional 2-polyprenyl-6-hydroxyphenol methylase/3-demethylubiquinol 3-O-methyltransferase UbiG [Accumulibacter sp.]
MNAMHNADPLELDKFGRLAHRWWDSRSEFKPLHEINPLRLAWIEQRAGLAGKTALDVGCGGGILSEGLARRGASVMGIDLSEKALGAARLHLLESGMTVDYRLACAEELARQMPGAFDIVTCMEMLEHVPDPASAVAACAALAKPGGHVFFSTLNRNLAAYLLAIVGAERALGLLPKGTHDYARFIKPSELSRWARSARLEPDGLTGISYDPLRRQCRLCRNVGVNYLMHAVKPA